MKVDFEYMDLCHLKVLLIKSLKKCNDEMKSLKELKKYYLCDDCYDQFNNEVAEMEYFIKTYSKILKDIDNIISLKK